MALNLAKWGKAWLKKAAGKYQKKPLRLPEWDPGTRSTGQQQQTDSENPHLGIEPCHAVICYRFGHAD
jgi:hypothetical protein